MARFRTAQEVASLALERVGAFAPTDTGPDSTELGRALERLDLIVAETVGTMRAWWLVAANVQVPLAPGAGDFDLITAAGGAIKTDGVGYIVDAKLRRLAGTEPIDDPLERLTRRQWDAVTAKAATGDPQAIYIDRSLRRPHVWITPYPTVNPTNLALVVTIQRYADDITGMGKGARAGLEPAWDRFLEYQTAADIGSGPVRRISAAAIQDWRKEAQEARHRVESFTARQGAPWPPRTRYRDF